MMTRSARFVGVSVSCLIFSTCGAGYIAQYWSTQNALMQTGGLGMSTSAINQMISEANARRNQGENIKYHFPEWGFWTQFKTLTANQIPYSIDGINWEKISSEIADGAEVKVYSWSELEAKKILEFGNESYKVRGDVRLWKNRDGTPSFYEVTFTAL